MFRIMTSHPIGQRDFPTREEALSMAEAFGMPARWVHAVTPEGEVTARVPVQVAR